MIPLVGEKKELKYVKDVVVEIAELVKKEKNSGTMSYPHSSLTSIAASMTALVCILAISG